MLQTEGGIADTLYALSFVVRTHQRTAEHTELSGSGVAVISINSISRPIAAMGGALWRYTPKGTSSMVGKAETLCQNRRSHVDSCRQAKALIDTIWLRPSPVESHGTADMLNSPHTCRCTLLDTPASHDA